MRVRALCEGAVLVAVAQILSYLKLWEMPWGGSVVLSMIPLVLYAVRWGLGAGLLGGFAFGVLQFMFDGGFAIGWQSIIGDYLLAFTVLGFACLIAKPFRSRTVGVGVSAFVVCLLRFLCSFLSGYIVWKDYDYAFSWMTEIGFPGISNMSVDGLCWLYSAVYNATYMLPEAILTTVLVVILIRVAPQIFDRQNARA